MGGERESNPESVGARSGLRCLLVPNLVWISSQFLIPLGFTYPYLAVSVTIRGMCGLDCQTRFKIKKLQRKIQTKIARLR